MVAVRAESGIDDREGEPGGVYGLGGRRVEGGGAGGWREEGKERRAVYGAWLSVAIINHILVSRLAPRRQGYHSKGIR